MYTFFWSLFKYKIRYETGQQNLQDHAKNIRLQAEKLNPVWQKFCQVLACRDDIIGEILANELRKLLDKCPPHDHLITDYLISEEMPEEEFTTPFSDEYLIGSGTIAQVYKAFNSRLNKWVAVKVKHSNIDIYIEEAAEQYKKLSQSIWFPRNLIACGNEFFDGLYKQADFKLEFNSGLRMKAILHESIKNSKYPSVFIIPMMLKYSKSIIIMDYEPGDYNLLSLPSLKCSELSPQLNISELISDATIQYLIGLIMMHLQIIGMYHGLLHSDLHWGNFSIRLNPLHIILYDFGWIVDISRFSLDFRMKWAKSLLNRDIVAVFELIIQNLNIPIEDKKYHMNNIRDIVDGMELGCNTYLFSDKFKRILLYYQQQGLVYNENLISVIYSCIHLEKIEKMLSHMIPSPDDVLKILSYAEFQCLKEL